jgi:hypothetical protein
MIDRFPELAAVVCVDGMLRKVPIAALLPFP